MNRFRPLFVLLLPLLMGTRIPEPVPAPSTAPAPAHLPDDAILSYIVDPAHQQVQLFWKNNEGKIISSLQGLKTYVEANHEKLVFAMNGGMFKLDRSPVGLYIQDYKPLSPIDTGSGNGNFYLQPNGVFYITKQHKALICPSKDFRNNGEVAYATQSGPMLLINGQIHPAFTARSSNTNIRNGVGILPDGRILLAISKTPINFYDFATFFKEQGCQNALFLDGFVSRAYLPEQGWSQLDGNFGVMIGVTVNQ